MQFKPGHEPTRMQMLRWLVKVRRRLREGMCYATGQIPCMEECEDGCLLEKSDDEALLVNSVERHPLIREKEQIAADILVAAFSTDHKDQRNEHRTENQSKEPRGRSEDHS